MCLLWQGFFLIFWVFTFWHLASLSAFLSNLIFLWQACIGLLWSSSWILFFFFFLSQSSTSASAFSFGVHRWLHLCLCLCICLHLCLGLSFNWASHSPSSGFISITFVIKIALVLSLSCSTHPLHSCQFLVSCSYHVCSWHVPLGTRSLRSSSSCVSVLSWSQAAPKCKAGQALVKWTMVPWWALSVLLQYTGTP